MINRVPPNTGFQLYADELGIYHLVPTTRLSHELTSAILTRITLTAESGALPSGVLLDVRRSPLLSLVRLGALIEELSTLRAPLAVILADETQQRLATLLHNTVRHRERIAYFITPDDAALFLSRHRLPRACS